MKHLLLLTLTLFLSIQFSGLLKAQEKPDYTLLLNSGNFVPTENSRILSQNSELFRQSRFLDKHYLTVQFYSLPDQDGKNKLKAAGITLIDYLPNLAYTAAVQSGTDPAVFKNNRIRSVFQLSPEQKTVPALLQGNFPAYAVKQPGFVDVTVILYDNLEPARFMPALASLKASMLEEMPLFRTYIIRVPQQQIKQIIALPFLQWVEPIDAPNEKENLLGRTLHRVNTLNDGVRNLKGDGINVGIWDGGEVSPHIDFSPVATRLTMMETNQADSHSTHVAGTIGGRGIINPKARGMAPNATIYSYNFSGNIQNEMATAIPALNLNISSHSYGSTQTCGVTGAGVAYSSTSRNTDLNLNTNPSHLHVHSAGNSQTACSGGWSTITGSGKTAKNNILVANITSTEAMSGSSSFGPVHDGRVKPEISSLGTNVLSTYTPLNTYGTISGTSMATPGVSGTLALLVQRYKQLNANTLPPSSLIKAAVCNTAQDLGNPGPDYKFGFGRINALAAVRTLEENRYEVNTVASGANKTVTVTVPSGALKLKVMLTWNDPAGTANAAQALVNNLDLTVENGASITLPWILDKNNPGAAASRATDNISNIEQVTIDNPAAGNYILRVNGTAVPSGTSQQYSLTWEILQPTIQVIYPNGLESFSPGTQETITWDNAGITGNQTLQYSTNNGATWTTISTTVPANTTRYNWTVPSGLNTAAALIRVSSGSLADVSDTTFNILGSPATLNATTGACAGSLNFVWPAVTNATHYDLFKLDPVTGNWDTLATNVSGNNYAATGLPSNTSMWFTLRSKNNQTGAVSEKALAINRTTSAGNAIALGNISGPAIICSGSQTVTYSVPTSGGVSSYNWSVPPGTMIISGQGTNTITVAYGGNSTGSISVYGITGSCQTQPSTLNVSAGTSVPAPTSGGDQTICASGPATTLTATATAPAGFSLVWYTAPSGGSPVTAPTLQNAGTITYYAASFNQNGGCESATRTPVTLTITNAVQPTISSNGGNSICEGNSLILTASTGTAYLWSTGETTPSITVKETGAYTVTTWQANGCSAVSAPINITVTPNPAVNIKAGPYTSLYPGLSLILTATPATRGTYTYIWKKNGIVIPGRTFEILPVDIDGLGTYTVTAVNEQGCAATSRPITIADSVSTSAFIYPNPNTGKFQLRYHNQPNSIAKTSVLIYDSKGSRVATTNYTVTTTYGKMEVDMRKQSSGIYHVLLLDEAGKKLASGKVIVQ